MINFITCEKRIINLQRRPDRLTSILKACVHHNFQNYKVVPAIDGETLDYQGSCTKAQAACKLSHLNIIKQAKEDHLPYVAILEDDCEFTEYFNSKCSQFLQEVPPLWDIIYLGGQHKKKLHPISSRVASPSYLCSTHCYIVNHTAFSKIIKILEENDKPIDLIYVEYAQMKMNVYCAWPNLVLQSAGYSDVEKQNIDYRPFMNTILNGG